MPDFQYDLGDHIAHVSVSETLAASYRADARYREVIPVAPAGDTAPVEVVGDFELAERHELEQQAAELKGPKLDAAAKAAGVEGVSAMTADEKRAAIVDAQLGDTESGAAGDTKEN